MIDSVSRTIDQWPQVRDKIVNIANKCSKSATLKVLQIDLSLWVASTRDPFNAIRDLLRQKGISFYETSTTSANKAFRWALPLIVAGMALVLPCAPRLSAA